MNIFLDISDAEIESLKPDIFAKLVLRLYQQEFSDADIPYHNKVIKSGKDSESDRGVDIVVKGIPSDKSFIKRAPTSIQVKAKKDFHFNATIKKEMRPKKELRESIKQLIEQKGAYVIAYSRKNLSDAKIEALKEAMREAIEKEDPENQLALDFLDQGRITSWVNSRPTIMLWLRSVALQVKTGYLPYGNWAHDPSDTEDVESELLVDEESNNGLRIILNNKQQSVKDGLTEIRKKLREPKECIRLTGLSGVGKTRMAQALFDERIGTDALPQHWAIYADCSEILNPDINNTAKQLMQYPCIEKSMFVLIVDNCPSDVHHKLVKICTNSNNKNLSLLTIEHDVQEDEPEDTSVCKLEPSSDDIIMRLVRKKFPEISETTTEVIAKMSDGNFRFANILSKALIKTEGGVATLDDGYIFERIFWQGRQKDDKLLKVAQVISLVYSFNIDTEVEVLAELAKMTSEEFHDEIAELQERQIIQCRGPWRALLPPALANRLAKQVLKPRHKYADLLIKTDEKRLLTSFAHRLSYLHKSDESVEIVKKWLKLGGYIEKNFDIKIFTYVASTSPKDALKFIERAADKDSNNAFLQEQNIDCLEFEKTLWHLAYDKKLFEESVKLLCEFTLLESSDEYINNINSIPEKLKLLFSSCLSGTQASVDMRINIVKKLFKSNDTHKAGLGISLMDGALNTEPASSSSYEFGAHKRDYGINYMANYDCIKKWYTEWINLAKEMALSEEYADDVQKCLIKHFRPLCRLKHGQKEIHTPVIDVVRTFKEEQPRIGLWLATYETIYHDSKYISNSRQTELKKLRKELAPSTPVEKAMTILLGMPPYYKFENNDEHYYENSPLEQEMKHTETYIRKVGCQIGKYESDVEMFLQKTTNVKDDQPFDAKLVHTLGKGLADGCTNQKQCFDMLRKALKEKIKEKIPNAIEPLIRGYLKRLAKKDPNIYNDILDELLEDDVLGKDFPIFQLTSTIDEQAIKRLHKSLDLGNALPNSYKYIAWGRAHEKIKDTPLATLLEKLLARKGGLLSVVEILGMRFSGGTNNTGMMSKSLHTFTYKVLRKYIETSDKQNSSLHHYKMEKIWAKYLAQENNKQNILYLVQCLVTELNNLSPEYSLYWSLLSITAEKHPNIYLDHVIMEIDEYYFNTRQFPLDKIPDKTIIDWCEKDPEKRYIKIVKLARSVLYKTTDNNNLEWKPIVDQIIKNAPGNLSDILDGFSSAVLSLGTTVGNPTSAYKKRFSLIDALSKHKNKIVSEWQKDIHKELKEHIDRANQPDDRYRNKDYGFE